MQKYVFASAIKHKIYTFFHIESIITRIQLIYPHHINTYILHLYKIN